MDTRSIAPVSVGLALLSSLGGAAASAAAAPATGPARAVEIRSYRIDASSATTLAGGGAFALRLAGTLEIAAPAGRAATPTIERWDLGAVRALPPKAGSSQVAAFPGLDIPVFVERDAAGTPIHLAFDSSVARGTRQVVEYMVGELQAARPPGGDVATWSRVERDTTGCYRADYRRAGGTGTVTKIKRAYEPDAGRPRVEVLRSERRMRLGPDGVLAEVDGIERLGIPDAGSQTESGFSAKLAGRARASWATGSLAPPVGAVRFDFGTAGVLTQSDRDAVTLAGQTLDGVLAAARTSSGPDLFRALGRLEAFLRRDPAAAAAIEAEADSGRGSLPRLLAALVESGSASADALLARWLTGRSTERAHIVASELLLRHPPHPILVEALVRVASERANPDWLRCTYALGAAASLLRSANPEAAHGLVVRLLAEEALAPAADRAVYLTALGNTGHPDVVPRLGTRAGHADPAVAEAAALALGHVATDDATRLLDRAARHASDPIVRSAALRACGHRTPALVCHSLRERALEDRDPAVRRAALDAARAIPGEAGPLLLRQMSAHDSDPELRRYASDRLAELAAPAPARTRPPAITWQATPAASN